MGYKHAQWRWSGVLVSLVLLMMPMIMCAMEQKGKVENKGRLRHAHRNILMKVSWNGHKEIVDRLINAGADINVVNNNGNTALMEASYNGYKEIVDRLINAGAAINASDKYDYTALMGASNWGHKEIVDRLINAGAAINASDKYGYTALMEASYWGHKEIADCLIKTGANINAANRYGVTALMEASWNGKEEVVDNLIKGGANPYIKNKKGKNSLDLADDEEELKKHIIKKRNKYVIKKYKEYLIDGKSRMENLAVSLQKECDWYTPYWDEGKGNHNEQNLQEVKQPYPFPKDIAGVIARFTHGISDDEWAQMCRLENEEQLSK